MAGKLPPAGWLQRDSPLEPLLEPDSGLGQLGDCVAAEEGVETQRKGSRGGLSELAFQGLVYGLVLAPPLRLAIGNPASFFGMLNVRHDAALLPSAPVRRLVSGAAFRADHCSGEAQEATHSGVGFIICVAWFQRHLTYDVAGRQGASPVSHDECARLPRSIARRWQVHME